MTTAPRALALQLSQALKTCSISDESVEALKQTFVDCCTLRLLLQHNAYDHLICTNDLLVAGAIRFSLHAQFPDAEAGRLICLDRVSDTDATALPTALAACIPRHAPAVSLCVVPLLASNGASADDADAAGSSTMRPRVLGSLLLTCPADSAATLMNAKHCVLLSSALSTTATHQLHALTTDVLCQLLSQPHISNDATSSRGNGPLADLLAGHSSDEFTPDQLHLLDQLDSGDEGLADLDAGAGLWTAEECAAAATALLHSAHPWTLHFGIEALEDEFWTWRRGPSLQLDHTITAVLGAHVATQLLVLAARCCRLGGAAAVRAHTSGDSPNTGLSICLLMLSCSQPWFMLFSRLVLAAGNTALLNAAGALLPSPAAVPPISSILGRTATVREGYRMGCAVLLAVMLRVHLGVQLAVGAALMAVIIGGRVVGGGRTHGGWLLPGVLGLDRVGVAQYVVLGGVLYWRELNARRAFSLKKVMRGV